MLHHCNHIGKCHQGQLIFHQKCNVGVPERYICVCHFERDLGKDLNNDLKYGYVFTAKETLLLPCWTASGHFGTVLGKVFVTHWPTNTIWCFTISEAMKRLRMSVWLKPSLDATIAVPILQIELNVTPVVPWVVSLWKFSEGFTWAKAV